MSYTPRHNTLPAQGDTIFGGSDQGGVNSLEIAVSSESTTGAIVTITRRNGLEDQAIIEAGQRTTFRGGRSGHSPATIVKAVAEPASHDGTTHIRVAVTERF